MSLNTDWLTFLTPSGARSSALPADLCALIVDTVQAPATFLLTNLLAKALRQSPARQSTLVGLAHTLDHYDAILKKNVRLRACPRRSVHRSVRPTPGQANAADTDVADSTMCIVWIRAFI